jgi:hypothetical protein
VSVPSAAVVCRTVVVLAYLVALAAAGRPGWGAALAAPALLAVWLAPLVIASARHRARRPADVLVAPEEVPAG